MRGGEADPLRANVVHVRENRRDGADFAGRFGAPCGRVEIFDQELVHAFIGGEDPDGGWAELSVNLLTANFWLAVGHGSLLLGVMIRPLVRPMVSGAACKVWEALQRNFLARRRGTTSRSGEHRKKAASGAPRIRSERDALEIQRAHAE